MKEKKKVSLFKKLFGSERDDYFNSAIIVAAGSGSRMKSDKTKQLMDIMKTRP